MKYILNTNFLNSGYDNYDNILLAMINNNYKVTIYEKNVKPDKNTVLE